MRVALDTNILAYAEGVGDKARCNAALQLVEQLPSDWVLLPAQTLGELSRVLTGKAKRSSASAREAVFAWADSFEVVDSTWPAIDTRFRDVLTRFLTSAPLACPPPFQISPHRQSSRAM